MPRDLLGDMKGPDMERGEAGKGSDKDKDDKKDRKKEEKSVPSEAGNQKFLAESEEIRSQIVKLEGNVREIENLHNRALNAVTEEQGSGFAQQLDKLMAETNKMAQTMRTKLKAMDTENKKYQSKGGDDWRVRVSQHQTNVKKFMDVMEKYKGVQQNYQGKYKDRLKRQFKIVKPNATNEEVEKVIESGDVGPIFAQSIVMSGQQVEARAALEDIQNRHEDIVRIERSIIELQQLFMDMAVMVQAQGEMLNRIEDQVNIAVEATENGVQSLRKANKLQRKARRKQCIIVLCLIVILVIIAAVLGGVLGKK